MLTKRESEVLGLVVKGLSSKEIANKLFLSMHTVLNHRKNLRRKTDCHNTAQLIQYYHEYTK
jgi:DNA-binding CsgD family transcriptional regulator